MFTTGFQENHGGFNSFTEVLKLSVSNLKYFKIKDDIHNFSATTQNPVQIKVLLMLRKVA